MMNSLKKKDGFIFNCELGTSSGNFLDYVLLVIESWFIGGKHW